MEPEAVKPTNVATYKENELCTNLRAMYVGPVTVQGHTPRSVREPCRHAPMRCRSLRGGGRGGGGGPGAPNVAPPLGDD